MGRAWRWCNGGQGWPEGEGLVVPCSLGNSVHAGYGRGQTCCWDLNSRGEQRRWEGASFGGRESSLGRQHATTAEKKYRQGRRWAATTKEKNKQSQPHRKAASLAAGCSWPTLMAAVWGTALHNIFEAMLSVNLPSLKRSAADQYVAHMIIVSHSEAMAVHPCI